MDLRSIVNAEDTPDARKLPAAQCESPTKENARLPSVPFQERGKGGGLYEGRASSGPENHEGRLSYPPPIRTASYNDRHSSSVSPSVKAKHNSHPPMRPSIDPTVPQVYHERGSASSSQGQHSFSTPLTRTPTGSSPGSAGAYSAFQRPTSSHSATPGSIQYHPSSLIQRSPQSANSHARIPSQPQKSPHYASQPHTPLGPPSGRPSYNISQDSPSTHTLQRSYPNGLYGQQHSVVSPVNVNKPPLVHSSQPIHAEHMLSAEPRAREQSPSISPKTRIDALPVSLVPDNSRTHLQASDEQTAPPPITAHTLMEHADTSEPEIRPLPRRATSSFAIGELLNEAPSVDRSAKDEVVHALQSSSSEGESFRKTLTTTDLQSPKPPIPSQDPTSSKINHHLLGSAPALVPISGVPSVPGHPPLPMEGVQGLSRLASTNPELSDNVPDRVNADRLLSKETGPTAPSMEPQHTRKKPRLGDNSAPHEHSTATEGHKMQTGTRPANGFSFPKGKQKRSRQIPIFAQSVRHVGPTVNGSSNSSNKGRLSGMPSAGADGTFTALPVAQVSAQSAVIQEANSNMQTNGTYVPIAQPERDVGPLGPWEPSILDIHPTEDMTKVISDWLFSEVVQKQGIGVGPAGGSANKGAVLEIEAKIGRLIDQNTNDRLRLPVVSECVISQSDPNMRVNFESSMTEPQHRAMNGFLNKAVQDSLQKVTPATAPLSKKRIPIRYHHTYETDRFYELSQQGLLALPLAITDYIEARHKRKTTVRITNDQKTGREIAKIVKARLADINVYSPRTLFDYRISVNVEMNFEGSMADLVEPDRARGRKPDRNKDRMSYTHLAYQIDLTQVTPTEGSNKAEKEHELEVEVSSEEVRRQGLLAMNGQDHEYDKLVKGFLDNVRVLARHCQPQLR